jgi:LPS sulfotransferase NodH
MYTHHKLDHEFEGGAETRLSYMICAVPRSGSSLLCELLCLTELAGAPTEFFDGESMEQFSRSWGTDTVDDYLETLMSRKTSPNGIFGLKAHYPQLEQAIGNRDPAELFPSLRFVYINRRDHLKQAISYARALQTGRWASDHEVQSDGGQEFKPDQIRRLLAQIGDHEECWERFFARQGAEPFRVSYEELVEVPAAVVQEIMRFIGVELPDEFVLPMPTLERQADDLSEDWVRRFRSLDHPRARSTGI